MLFIVDESGRSLPIMVKTRTHLLKIGKNMLFSYLCGHGAVVCGIGTATTSEAVELCSCLLIVVICVVSMFARP